jgi:hypothetical protein
MKKFKFLQIKVLISEFRPVIIERIYDLCREYMRHIEICKAVHQIANPDEEWFPIPYKAIESQFPEGKLWHGGSDLDEDNDKLIHTLLLDINNDESNYYIFEVEETLTGELIMLDIDRESFDRSTFN